MINRYNGIVVSLYVSSFEMCKVLARGQTSHTHTHFLVTNKTPKTYERMVSLGFVFEWNVAILNKGNPMTRTKY
jgi:hypothetical protein